MSYFHQNNQTTILNVKKIIKIYKETKMKLLFFENLQNYDFEFLKNSKK